MKQLLKSIFPNFLIGKYRKVKDEYLRKRAQISFSGDDVFCPLCKSSYSKFGPFGLNKRENARCHNCGSLERHRLLALYFQQKFKVFENVSRKIRLLHIAPEKVFYELFSKHPMIDYFPCDLHPEEFEFQDKIAVEKIDVTAIPFESESFDFILCNHVLEHVEDDQLAMTELHRVMVKGGNGIFQVPVEYNREKTYEDFSITSPKGRTKAFGQADHVRIYGRDYKVRLKESGFKVLEVDFVSQFSAAEIFKYGLLPSEHIYHCKKERI